MDGDIVNLRNQYQHSSIVFYQHKPSMFCLNHEALVNYLKFISMRLVYNQFIIIFFRSVERMDEGKVLRFEVAKFQEAIRRSSK